MAAVSHNHVSYEASLDFIREETLAEHLSLFGRGKCLLSLPFALAFLEAVFYL